MLTRRSFLCKVSVAGGGLALAAGGLGGCARQQPWPNREGGVLQADAFLKIDRQGSITLALHKAEMGQGVMTGLATLVAEELEVDPASLQLTFAQPHVDYVDESLPMMSTGASSSIANNFERMRRVGATARTLLVQAAAARWSVPIRRCIARDGRILLDDGSREASYGELASHAARLPIPQDVELKSPREWRLIGRYDRRVDSGAKSDGSAVYAIDVSRPGMLTAVLVRCPQFGGRLRRFAVGEALKQRGVRRVVELNGCVAVLAEGYWQARRGAAALEVEWEDGPLAGLDSNHIANEQSRLLDAEEGRVVREDGEPAQGGRLLEAEYGVPYLAHATMEPMSAVAAVSSSGAEIWAGNQAPDMVRNLAARLLDLPRERVIVHTTLLGGGFGRRAIMDFVLEAVALSKIAGVPVKVVWSREDDMRHDHYRPASLARFRATIDAQGTLRSWSNRIVGPSILEGMMPTIGAALLPAWIPAGVTAPVGRIMRSRDKLAYEGAVELPYAVPHIRVEFLPWDPGVPASIWRSVGHSQNAFFTECFADEVAHALGEDPLEFRLKRLPPSSRLRGVLSLCAERAGWGRSAPGRFQGIAAHESYGSFVAEVVEVSLEDRRIVVQRVCCAVDCGLVVNPGIVRAQVEGAVVQALSAALYGEITIAGGAVVQGNFDDQPVVRIDECPLIDVHSIASDAAPSGIGEPGLPPLAPALANACFAATARRQRRLPLSMVATAAAAVPSGRERA